MDLTGKVIWIFGAIIVISIPSCVINSAMTERYYAKHGYSQKSIEYCSQTSIKTVWVKN